MLFVLWSVFAFVNLMADNVIKIPPQKVATNTQSAQTLAFNKEIESLEQNGKNIDEYTTKYFKKRVDYSLPFSSEAKDYADSVLIERERKTEGAKLRYNKNIASESKRESNKYIRQSAESKHNVRESSGDSKQKSSVSTKSDSPNVPNPNALTTASLSLPKPFSEPKKVYKKVLDSHKPKVVIIIDDIATPKQLSDIVAIQDAGLKLTPSIFPVAQGNTQMLERVAHLEFFMVHLPLEALAYKDELDTISIYDSEDSIKRKIARIKQTLPNTLYINNHTGSKFTERRANMEFLLSVLDSHNINFVDSRTTQNTTLPDIAKAQNRLILYRDIFIDNALDSHSLNTQINEGIKIAKARGYAILIAHPHKETLNAIRAAKNGALREVDVIYLNELDFLLKKSNITQYAQVLKSP